MCYPQCLKSRYYASLFAIFIDKTHFTHTDLLVDPQIFLCQLASSAAGSLLLTGEEKRLFHLPFRQLKGAAYIIILIPVGKGLQVHWLQNTPS